MKWKKLITENWDDLEVDYDQRQEQRRRESMNPKLVRLVDFIETNMAKISNKVWDYYVKKYGQEKGEELADKWQAKFLIDDKMIEWIENH